MQIFLTPKNTKTLFLMLLLTSITYTFTNCKKDRSFLQNKLALNKSAGSFSSYYSFDASHNVLVFEKFSDVEALEDALDNYENNYPYNRGNDHLIYVTLDSIMNIGWTNGNNPNTNKVKIGNFVSLLEDSYPLSDTVLKEILWTHDVVNPSFAVQLVKPIFEQNASFSYEVRTEITESNLPNGIKNQILNKEDNTVMIPNFAYDDFLAEIPSYMSLYKTLETQERINLESGMDPADPNFDNDIVRFDFERLVMNFNHEIYIQGYLFKLYDSCKLAIFKGSIPEAYASLAMLDNGIVEIPNISETINGIPEAVVQGYIPTNFIMTSPDNVTYIEGRDRTPVGIDMFASASIEDKYNCPHALFTHSVDLDNQMLLNFNSATYSNYIGPPIFKIWNFGDGTYSFQDNPQHLYSNPGSYSVSLTVFNNECGCWDVYKQDIAVGLSVKSCDTDFNVNYVINSPGEVTLNIINATNQNPSASILEYIVSWGDGTQSVSPNPTFNHTYAETGLYNIIAVTYWDDNCSSPSNNIQITAITQVQCCDRYDNYNSQTIDIFNDNSAKLKIEGYSNGSTGFLGFGAKETKAKQKFFRRKNNGGYTSAKALHEIRIYGFYKTIKPESGIERCDYNENIVWNSSLVNYNTKKTEKHSYPNLPSWNRIRFGLDTESVKISHWVQYGTKSRGIEKKLGKCN